MTDFLLDEAIFESSFVPLEFGGPIGDWQSEEATEDFEGLFSSLAQMNWTQAERQLIERLAERWQFEDLLNFLYAKVLELPEEQRNSALDLLERYSPPKSLVQAMQAMTPEQKGHIRELLGAGRRRAKDLRKIALGLVATLPDEDAKQATRFIRVANNFLHLW